MAIRGAAAFDTCVHFSAPEAAAWAGCSEGLLLNYVTFHYLSTGHVVFLQNLRETKFVKEIFNFKTVQ